MNVLQCFAGGVRTRLLAHWTTRFGTMPVRSDVFGVNPTLSGFKQDVASNLCPIMNAKHTAHPSNHDQNKKSALVGPFVGQIPTTTILAAPSGQTMVMRKTVAIGVGGLDVPKGVGNPLVVPLCHGHF